MLNAIDLLFLIMYVLLDGANLLFPLTLYPIYLMYSIQKLFTASVKNPLGLRIDQEILKIVLIF